ncbi:MAG: endonuclease Q family protein [Candidatus Omnitrophica bacterium]|nr:endonuclease Q family protein [Candidatus Omnitrophota bacterium]
MKFIADLHIHSHYSLATSKLLSPEHLDYWARIKGITVVGTGDFTHPKWIAELKQKTEPAEDGLYKLKKEHFMAERLFSDKKVRFILSSEISCVYKKNNRVRKTHSIILAPDLKTVEIIQKKLTTLNCNISSDGRPIIGMDTKNLLDLVLSVSKDCMLIPAHIWTPWFSLFGSRSGFDSVEECFGDLSQYIFALETGLSSDIPMNRLCSFLDKYTLISNSDAHSPEKLGRNANIFNTDLSYKGITEALKTNNKKTFNATIDMFPQEGKYHYDGHRKCGICMDPFSSIKHENICPVCNKLMTLGVYNRVAKLSDRKKYTKNTEQPDFFHIIPLKEILSEILNVGVNSQRLTNVYFDTIKELGPELDILLSLPIEKITNTEVSQDLFNTKTSSNPILQKLANSLKNMREEKIKIQHGYDGEYGKISAIGS